MAVCPKCSRQFDDEAKFCDGCGEKIVKSITCPSCGKQMSGGFKFCQYCGKKLDAGQTIGAAASVAEAVSNAAAPVSNAAAADFSAQMPVQTDMPYAPAAAVKKPFPKRAVLFGGVGLAAATIIVVLIIIIVGSFRSLGDNFAVYAKSDGELYLDRFSGDPWQMTRKFGAPSNGYIFEDADQIAACITVSKDGKTIFYPDRSSNFSAGFNLYYKGINSENDGTRIDTSVLRYSVNSSASVVTYVKAGDNELYRYSLKNGEKSKIDSNVRSFLVTDDGKKIIYNNSDDSIYFYSSDTDSKEKIDSNAAIKYCSNDLSVLYYTKGDKLYRKAEGEDKVKIASDVQTVYMVYDDDKIYYTRLPENGEVHLMDYVEDDMKDTDAHVTEPVYPEYPNYPNYPTYPSRPYRFRYDSQAEYEKALEEYNKAVEKYEGEVERYNKEVEKLKNEYDAAVEKYYDNYSKYWDKVSRDSLRDFLKEASLDKSIGVLCCHDGTEEKILSSSFCGFSAVSSGSAVMVFSAYMPDPSFSVKLSEVQDANDVRDRVNEALFSETEEFIAADDSVSILPGIDSSYMMIDDNGENLYYIVWDEGEEEGKLYSAAISGGTIQSPELYDTDVNTMMILNGELAYWKELDYDASYIGKGELYIDKDRVDYDIVYESVEYSEALDAVIYLTDIDSKGIGTLKVYKNGSAEKIADDAADHCVLPNGKIIYLCNYNINRNIGELYVYSGGRTEKVNDDVVAIFKISDDKYKGNTYYSYFHF